MIQSSLSHALGGRRNSAAFQIQRKQVCGYLRCHHTGGARGMGIISVGVVIIV